MTLKVFDNISSHRVVCIQLTMLNPILSILCVEYLSYF